jgi:hypothetical protein
MPDAPPHAIRCLKPAGLRSVWLVHRPGEDPRTVKGWALTPWLALKLMLGLAQPQRQRRGSRRLGNAGVFSPRIFRLCLSRRGRWPVVQLESQYIAGRTALELLNEDSNLLDAKIFGELVTTLAAASLFNRDLKLSNLVLDRQGRLFVIDPVGVRLMRDPVRAIDRMLERLMIEPANAGITVPRRAVTQALFSALRPLAKPQRKAVLARLKAHRRR